ncbi:MAG: protein-disulfide reductase DsbD family protein, partial [Candidatus Hinthialibacter sp.]
IGGEGYVSALFMGLIAGVVAAPCTGPVLAGILAYVATTGNAILGISLLMVYSLGLWTLFLVIGTYSGMIHKLPKSGGWMESVKSVFAVILFVCALYFLKNIFPALQLNHVRDWAIYLIAALLLKTGIMNGAFHLSLHSPNSYERYRKAKGILACVVALYLPIGAQAPSGEGEVNWTTDLQAGLSLAEEENKPVMIDFWAEWCALCKEIDHYTFHDKTVADELNERFVNIKIDLTRDNTDEAQAIIQQYQIIGLPLIVFYNSQGELLEDKRINEFVEPAEFLDHIQDIP